MIIVVGIIWSIINDEKLLFSLINSLYELLLIIIECEISPLLFECCLYVGNVQTTMSNRWCELIPRVVIGIVLWYEQDGDIYMFCFPCYVLLLKLLLNHFWIWNLLCCWCWGLSAEFWLKRWIFSAAIFELLKAIVWINIEFNSIYIFEKTKCDIMFVMNSDLLYIIYMLRKRGVTDRGGQKNQKLNRTIEPNRTELILNWTVY